jgi:nicotinamide mononucleotide transporter
MAAVLDTLLSLEAVAVVLALAYLLLAARENILCWYCAFASSALYVVIFWDVSLFMEVGLNVFYVVMAVAGWYEWRHGGRAHAGVSIVSLSWWQHGVLLGAMLALALLNGWVMQRYTSAAWPFLDSFITWSSVLTTLLVVRKVLENWLYWLLIDGLAIYVYIDRGLYLTALLFALYLVIVVFGYVQWRREWLEARGVT